MSLSQQQKPRLRIIFVHGLANKPEAEILKQGLYAAIKEGLEKNEGYILKDNEVVFDSVYWANVMYSAPDAEYDAYKPYDGNLRECKHRWYDAIQSNWRAALDNIVESTAEFFDIRDKVLKAKLKDLHLYYTDDEKQDILRSRLFDTLQNNDSGTKTILVAHSMGSIIAYDILRILGRMETPFSLDHFVTIGSPLGMNLIKDHIRDEFGKVRVPSVVQAWTNMADKHDPVCAFDTHLSNDYERHTQTGVSVFDDIVYNSWGGINHKSYGYLRCPELSRLIASFL